MAELSLTAIFGAGATQSIDDLVISKSDLVAKGLTASANNSAESLLTALVKLWADELTEEGRDENIDQSIAVVQDAVPSFVSRIDGVNSITYVRDTFSIQLDKAYSAVEIDPDDY
jgi:hypothetical protein